MPSRLPLAAVAITALALSAGPAATHASTTAKSYKNCSALNKDYRHGVGRQGARDKTSTTPVTTLKRINTLYAHNDGGTRRYPGEYDLDRDNDGIACEKR